MTGPLTLTLPAGYILRPATPADAETVTAQRGAMFAEMEVGDEAGNAEALANFLPWVRARLRSGTYLGWLVESGGVVVAGAGLMLLDWPPHFTDPQPFRGYMLNVYTQPGHRGLGLARTLSKTVVAQVQARGIRILALHASKFGRPVYEGLGFVPTNEMWLRTGAS